jgi:hypothetical protein
VFKLTYTSGLSDSQKIKYANIARSSLSSDEVFLLTLNGLSEHGRGFVPLIEYFGLLKHVQSSEDHPTLDQLLAHACYNETARHSLSDRTRFWKQNPAEQAKLIVALERL